MRILQVFDFMSPQKGGGTVDILAKLSQGLVSRGHKVSICTSDYQLDNFYLNGLRGVDIHLYHNWGNLSGCYFTPGIINEIPTTFPDVIHFHCYRSFQNIVLGHFARRYQIPYLIEAHGSASRDSKYLLKLCYDTVFSGSINHGASRFVAETGVGVAEYRKLGIDPNRITIIHPPFNLAEFETLPSKGSFRPKHSITSPHFILFLGRIHWIKGLDFLIRSFAELCKTRNDVALVLAGQDDGYLAHLGKLTTDLGLSDRVHYVGFLTGTDKLSALVDADVLVQPSIREQGARPSFEALLCNTPVIVTRGTGAGEDISKIQAGWVIDYGDTVGLSQTILNILDHPSIAQFKTSRAREWIKANLSLESQVDKYEQLYREVLQGRRKG